MKHKLTIGVSNKSPKSRVVTYKKVSPEAKVKDVIGDASKVAIIVPGEYRKGIALNNFKMKKTYGNPEIGKQIWQVTTASLII